MLWFLVQKWRISSMETFSHFRRSKKVKKVLDKKGKTAYNAPPFRLGEGVGNRNQVQCSKAMKRLDFFSAK